MASGYNVTALSDFVKQNDSLLLKEAVIGETFGDIIPRMAHQLGVKGTVRLNYLSTDAILQEGGCGFNPSGSTVFSERDVETQLIKAQDAFCKTDLISKWTEYQVRVASTQNDPAPFESEIMDGVTKSINRQMETLVFQGNKSNGDLIDGLLTIALGSDSASTIAVDVPSGSSMYDAVLQTYMALPEELLNDAENTCIFLSPSNYRKYVQELVAAKFYAPMYTPNNEEVKDMFIPGTSIRVHKTMGMPNGYIYAGSLKNMVYACDMLSDSEEYDAWYSQDNQEFRYSIQFNAGVSTYFPDYVVVATIN